MDAIVNAATARLADFQIGWNDEEHIDKVSGLTAKDVDLILATLCYLENEPPRQSNPVMREIR